jgi:hypothetical protein
MLNKQYAQAFEQRFIAIAETTLMVKSIRDKQERAQR